MRLLMALALAWSSLAAAEPLPYQNPAQPVELRVDDLLERMTLAEKVGQMTQVNVTRLMGLGEWDRGPLNDAWLETVLAHNHVGSLLSGGGAAPVPNTPRAWAELTNDLQRYALEHSRLGIPILYGTDAVHGHNNVLGATIFPHNLGLAASFNPDLVQRVAAHTARDMRATGVHWTFAPVADLGRDPRWGRFYETFGEDPLLASSLVAASVEGFQEEGVAATLKHFIAYSQPLTGRDRSPAFIDERSLRALHLPPFAAGVAAGALTAMANSGSLNGVPVHASSELLRGLLRAELGFGGVLVSDWNDVERLHTVHRVAASYEDAVAMSVDAGVDMVMVPHDAAGFTSRLVALVEEGRVSEARIDEAVGRILALKFALGLFERPYVDAAGANALVVERERSLAREAALGSLTLLKNEGTLPLEGVGTVLVTGPGADSVATQMGGWTIGWQGVPGPAEEPPAVTIFEGLRGAAPAGTEVRAFAAYADAAALQEEAARADVVVAVLGEAPYAEGPGDSESLELSEEGRRLLGALAATDTPVVVVILAGRPLVLEEVLDGIDALLMAYLPGSEGGGAVAEVLFGRADPAGRLPFTWPRRAGQLPLTYDRLPAEAPFDPLFAFGHGLSYTRFAYGEPTVRLEEDTVRVSVALTNTGARSGTEVVQVYVGAAPFEPAPGEGPVLQPVRRLVGFARAELAPGETQAVALELPLERLAAFPGDALSVGEPRVVPGTYTLSVGERRVRLTLP